MKPTRSRTLLLCVSLSLGAACAAPSSSDVPLVIAHRGASGHTAEHTLAAYDLALTMGADVIEQDLQMTRDGVLVALHDETLDRTVRGPGADCTGYVRDKTLAQLQNCSATQWWIDEGRGEPAAEPIPTLDAVLERYGQSTRYYIETKQPESAPGMEEELLAVLGWHDLLPDSVDDHTVLIQSFSPASLQKTHELNPTLPLVQLLGSDAVEEALRVGLDKIAEYAVGIGPSWRAVTPELIAAARENGLVVHPYTVDEPADMRMLIDAGVDGMFTNFPDRMVQVVVDPGR